MTPILFHAYLDNLDEDSIIKLSNFSKIPKKGISKYFGEIVCDYSEEGTKVSDIMEWLRNNCDGYENPIKINIMNTTVELEWFYTSRDGEVLDIRFRMNTGFLIKND